jgi:hypothetical protein
MFKIYLAIVSCGLLGLSFGGFALYDVWLLIQSLWFTPSNPAWDTMAGIGFFSGISKCFLVTSVVLWSLRYSDQLGKRKVETGGKQARARVRFFLIGGICILIGEPALYISGSFLFPEVLRNWIDGIPWLASGILFYLGTTYPFSFKWPLNRKAP